MVERRSLVAALLLAPMTGPAWAQAADERGAGGAGGVVGSPDHGPFQFPMGVTRISSDLVVHGRAQAVEGALISLARGVTITFEGGFDAPPVQVFAGEGTVAFGAAAQPVGHPEWWGARADDPRVDCAAAINACIEACAVTQLAQGHYYIRQSIRISRSGRTLRGVNEAQDPGEPSTQIVVDDPAITGIVCGVESRARSSTVDYLKLEDFAVSRARAVATPGSELRQAPAGIRLMWCALLRATRVTVREHAVGFFVLGCVECYLSRCSAIRYSAGGTIADDVVAGFFLDYESDSGFVGGNASIYLDECRAFTSGKIPFPYSAGLATRGGFSDLYVSKFETGFNLFGIDLQGDGAGSKSYSTQDCLVRDCVLDSNAAAGIRIRSAGDHCDVHILGCYVALAGGFASAACLVLGGVDAAKDALNGAITVGGCEFIGDYAGVRATNVAVCNLSGNSYLNLCEPVALTRVRFSEVRDVVRLMRRPPSAHAVVSLSQCEGLTIAMSASGVANGFRCGVSLDHSSARVEVNCTRFDPDAVGGAGRMIELDGSPWGGGPTFGNRNVATGAL